jgi:hypothetical protein
MVRKGGLEPPWSCDRQPLKLVRLPISPLPRLASLPIIKLQRKVRLLSARIARPELHQTRATSPAYFWNGFVGSGDGAFAGGLAGGFDFAGADCDCFVVFSSTDPLVVFVAQTVSVIDVAMKIAASTQVDLASVETVPRGPKAAWLTPPNAAVMSTFSPPWIITTRITRMPTRICSMSMAVCMKPSPQFCSYDATYL